MSWFSRQVCQYPARIRAHERSNHKFPEFVILSSMTMVSIVMIMMIVMIVIINEDIPPARIGGNPRGWCSAKEPRGLLSSLPVWNVGPTPF